MRGLNKLNKQDAVRSFLLTQNAGLVGLLETKVKPCSMGSLYLKMFNGWCFTSNASIIKGGRIIVAWNPLSFSVNILVMTPQLIHCVVQPKSGIEPFFCTFVYSFNESKEREKLWEDLISFKNYYKGAWVLLGDLNCVLNVEEIIGQSVRQGEMLPGRRCLESCGLSDIKFSGHYYTWSNKQDASTRVCSKLDRVMANDEWLDRF